MDAHVSIVSQHSLFTVLTTTRWYRTHFGHDMFIDINYLNAMIKLDLKAKSTIATSIILLKCSMNYALIEI